jgi:hypothetical protein
MSASTEFAASLPFFGYKQRNAVLDNFFYDTTRLSLEERAKLTPLDDREGSIVVVPPRNSDRRIRHYRRALRFMNKEGPDIRAIAVAGVGSSALGTAALARELADALDTDVAGIVTGFGLSEMMTEALSGWFAFGAADRIRSTMERAFARMRPAALAESVRAGSDASATLSEILLAGPPKLDTLVAHSKGSLIAAHALQLYVEDLEGDDSPLYERLRIITLGAVVGLPPAFKKVKQYLGAYDWFGGANSSLGVVHERVPGVSHHLNPGFPYHMSEASLLNGGAGGLPPRLLPKPALEMTFPPLSIPPVEVPRAKFAPVAAPVKTSASPRKPAAKKAAPKPATGTAKVAGPAPKVASPASRVARAAPKVAAVAPKAAPAASKVASPAPKVAGAAAKAPIEAVKPQSAAAKPATKPLPKKMSETRREQLRAAKAKTVAANGKLIIKKSKRGGGA